MHRISKGQLEDQVGAVRKKKNKSLQEGTHRGSKRSVKAVWDMVK